MPSRWKPVRLRLTGPPTMVGPRGHLIMPASQPAATPEHLKSRFLGGLAPRDLKVVLAAARQRQFFANSVVANQGHPADYLFLLTRGRARFFFNTREGKKVERGLLSAEKDNQRDGLDL